MNFTRTALTLLGCMALAGTSAFAQSINIGAGAQVNGGAQIAAPPVNVPPVNAPPVNAPPVNAPPVNVPRTNTVTNANANVKVNASSQTDADGVFKGTLEGVTGSAATVRMSNGTTQNYGVSVTTAQELRSSVGKPIAYRLQDGTMILDGNEGSRPLHGTLESLTGSTANVRLPNGTTQTYSVTSQQSALLKGHVGKTIVFRTAANGTLELNQRTRLHHRSR